ncbi:MAG: hypothetical protein AAB848_01240, partial [Patescibacteria group bacterium]
FSASELINESLNFNSGAKSLGIDYSKELYGVVACSGYELSLTLDAANLTVENDESNNSLKYGFSTNSANAINDSILSGCPGGSGGSGSSGGGMQGPPPQ